MAKKSVPKAPARSRQPDASDRSEGATGGPSDATGTAVSPDQAEKVHRATAALLDCCLTATGADIAVLLRDTGGGDLDVVQCTDPGLDLTVWPVAAGKRAQARSVPELAQTLGVKDLPEPLQSFGSLVAASVKLNDRTAMLLVLLSREPAAFDTARQAKLTTFADLLGRTLNELIPPPAGRDLAVPEVATAAAVSGTALEELSNSLDRLTDWQDRVLRLNDRLLSSTGPILDGVIDLTLAEIGTMTGSDRTYVFRWRPPGRLDNTHEWVAEGVDPMIALLQDMPDDLLADWRPEMERGRPVYIPEVNDLPDESAVKEVLRMQGIRSLLAVPLIREGAIAGFVGHDSVHSRRAFFPAEVRLLQSASNTIGAALARRDAEDDARRAREELEHEMDRLRATLASLPDLVLEVDSDGRFTDYNAGAISGPAFEPEAFLGYLLEDVLPPELAGMARDMMRVAEARDDCGAREYSLEVEGRQKRFSVSIGVKRNGGLAQGFVFLIRDITRLSESDRALRRLGKVVELTSNLVIIHDIEGNIEWVNPAFERRSGWHLHDVIGGNAWDLMLSDKNDPETIERMLTAERTATRIQTEVLTRSRSGEDYWTTIDFLPLHDARQDLEGFVSVQTDITPIKRSYEHELLLRATAMDTAIDAIAISMPEGRFAYMNPAHRKLFGLSEDEDITKLDWTNLIPAASTETMQDRILPILGEQGHWRGETKGLHSDGFEIDLDVSLTLTSSRHLICVARDITQRKRSEAEREQLREELQEAQKREALLQIGSGIAHDLNNLVAVVAGTVSLMQSSVETTADAQVSLRRIGRALDAAKDLVDRLGKLEQRAALRDLHDLRNIIVESIDLLGVDRVQKYSIHVELPSAAQPVWANRTELLQVIVNLVQNACEAGPEETNKVTLAILPDHGPPADQHPDAGTFVPGRRYVFLSIRDTGAGIPAALRPRLFERYMTTKGAMGTGLGLPIVAKILGENGGVIWLDSTEGAGTNVVVALPAQPVEARDMDKDRLGPRRATALAGKHILVVDDNADVAQVMSEMLEVEGAITVAISDPLEALELIRSEPDFWSALVTDFDMPQLDGGQLALEVSAAAPDLPCILVTALPESSGWDPRSFHAVLSKPLDRDAFVGSVGHAILRSGKRS